MDTKYYLISEKDYLAHIDRQIEMYDHLLTLAHETRNLLLDGKFAAVMRTLNRFEHQANETFLGWGVSDEYLSSSDPKDLQSLMRQELLEVPEDNGKEGCCGA